MRRMEWLSLLAVVALIGVAACEAQEEAAEEEAPAEAPPAMPPAAEPGPAPALPAGVTQEMVTQGQLIFTSNGNCFTCHGQDGTGTQLAPNLRDQQWLNVGGSYDEIVNLVKTGVPTPKEAPAPMPPMGGGQLTEDQVRAVAAYVYSISRGS